MRGASATLPKTAKRVVHQRGQSCRDSNGQAQDGADPTRAQAPVGHHQWGIINEVMRPMIELMMPTTCKNGHIPFSQHGATPSADPVHVSPCFGAPSCLVCLDEVALSQDEVGKSRIGAAPGEGDEGPKAQRVDMTKEDIYSMTQFTRYKAATTMRVRVSASLFILFCFLG